MASNGNYSGNIWNCKALMEGIFNGQQQLVHGGYHASDIGLI
jgi:hypothetical protein